MNTLYAEIADYTATEIAEWLADNDRAESAALAEVKRLTVVGRTTNKPDAILGALKNAQRDADYYGLIGMNLRAAQLRAV